MNFDDKISDSYENDANIDTNLDFFEQVNEWVSAENVYGDYNAYEDNYDTYEDELRKGKRKKMKKELKKHKKATKKLKRDQRKRSKLIEDFADSIEEEF